MKWKVYDHELLEAIAQGMEITTEEARAYDELAPSLIQDWLLPLREEHYAPQEAYLDHLAKLVQSIGRAGDSILVGRGASFLLPRNETLSVRLVAPIPASARRLSERLGVSVRTARRAARDLDRRAPGSSAPCIGPIPTTPTSTTWSSTPTAWASPSPSTSSPRRSNPAGPDLRNPLR